MRTFRNPSPATLAKRVVSKRYSFLPFGTTRLIPAGTRTITNASGEAGEVPKRTSYLGMPPHHKGTLGHIQTFELPQDVTGTEDNLAMARAMIQAWRKESIFQIKMTPAQGDILRESYKHSRDFFSLPSTEKAKQVNDQSFAGYIASGEELTDGIADYSEIFTVTKDLPVSDPRVQNKWPCHGPCPWPNESYKNTMNELMTILGESGEKLLKLTALGLGLTNINALTDMTEDGWHHMRVLRFPQVDKTNGKGKTGRGIGSHTDYGLLVLAGQDSAGGLFVRPKVEGESTRNWQSSAAGLYEDDEKWVFVPPFDDVLTVFPGDMMQYLTNDYLYSTPHKVGLNKREHYAFAYFHEPNFSSVVKPLVEYQDGVHYGTHFTNMFMRNYPDRVTAKRMKAENRMDILNDLRKAATKKQSVLVDT